MATSDSLRRGMCRGVDPDEAEQALAFAKRASALEMKGNRPRAVADACEALRRDCGQQAAREGLQRGAQAAIRLDC